MSDRYTIRTQERTYRGDWQAETGYRTLIELKCETHWFVFPYDPSGGPEGELGNVELIQEGVGVVAALGGRGGEEPGPVVVDNPEWTLRVEPQTHQRGVNLYVERRKP